MGAAMYRKTTDGMVRVRKGNVKGTSFAKTGKIQFLATAGGAATDYYGTAIEYISDDLFPYITSWDDCPITLDDLPYSSSTTYKFYTAANDYFAYRLDLYVNYSTKLEHSFYSGGVLDRNTDVTGVWISNKPTPRMGFFLHAYNGVNYLVPFAMRLDGTTANLTFISDESIGCRYWFPFDGSDIWKRANI